MKELADLVNTPDLALEKILAQFEMKKMPEDFCLNQNYPNPFNSTTLIQFSIPENSFVTINIYNVFGQLVKTIANQPMTEGYHSIKWDGTSNKGNIAASGIYYYIMRTNNFSERKTMTLLK